MKVEVAYSPAARAIDLNEIELPEGATAAEALAASGVLSRHATLAERPLRIGIWGRSCTVDSVVRDGDRVEVYRGLEIDPKEARRLRGARQKRLQKSRQR